MLKNPWWKEIKGPFPEWEGPVVRPYEFIFAR